MTKGFRDFLFRGNVIDLAVAVVVGTAFTVVVTTFTSALLKPLINIFLGGGVSGGKVEWMGQVFDFGAVINAIITFALVAGVVYFLVVVPMKRMMAKKELPAPPPPETETTLLAQIRDLLRQQSPQH